MLARSRFATADLEVARQFMADSYGGRLEVDSRTRPTDAIFSVSRLDAGPFVLDDLMIPARPEWFVHAREEVLVQIQLSGTAERERGKTVERYRTGDVLLGALHDAEFRVRTDNARTQVLTLPVRLLAEAAGMSPDGPRGGFRFSDPNPVSAVAAEHWKRTAEFVEQLLAGPFAPSSPMIIDSAARLLAATAVATFPHTLGATGVSRVDSQDGTPATLTRAVAFIDEHADQPIGVAEIAAAAYVTPRAVQYAFRRHLDTTPMTYLRRIRLARAHHELSSADPTGGATVTAIAARWGFHQHSRFATAYRATYGHAPRHTLRRDS